MKSILKLAFASLLIFASASFAKAETAQWTPKKLKVGYSSFRSYYACSFAEDRLESFLKQMGARQLRIRCSGGLPYDQFINLTATFESAQSSRTGERASWQTVTLTSRDSCDFNEALMKQIVNSGTFELRGLRTRSSCWDSTGRVGYEFQVLK